MGQKLGTHVEDIWRMDTYKKMKTKEEVTNFLEAALAFTLHCWKLEAGSLPCAAELALHE